MSPTLRKRAPFGPARRRTALFLCLLLVATLLPVVPRSHAAGTSQTVAPPAPRAPAKASPFVPGEVLVRFREGSTASAKARALLALRARDGSEISVEVEHFAGSELLEGLRLARVPAEATYAAVEALRAREDVLYAEPNYLRRASTAPNDTRYAQQWGFRNTGQRGGFPGIDISAESAWDATTGDHSVVVGVIDTGIDTGHRDLKENVFVNSAEVPGNNFDDDGNGYADDVSGFDFVSNDATVFDNAQADAHGTHVAGIVGARGNNATGVAGVNWDVRLMPLKVLNSAGYASDSTLITAYGYALAMKQRGVNLRVLNNSYGGQGFSQSLFDSIKQLSDAGILFVAAAGNETANNDYVPVYPANFDLPNVVSVAAMNESGSFASEFTNRGGQSVDLAAPGIAVLSTTPRGYAGEGLVAAYTDADGSTYSSFHGTSTAAPHVAGAAALACAAAPSVSLQKLRGAVVFNGDESGGLFTYTVSGRRLNASKTIQAALEEDATAPAAPANFRVNAQTGRRVELRWNESGDDGVTGRASLDEIVFVDGATGRQFPLQTSRPLTAGQENTAYVYVPVRHTAGQIILRTADNVGNFSTGVAAVTIAADVADPYTMSVGAAEAPSDANSGTRLNLRADDEIYDNYRIQFPFPFFGGATTSISVSTNGALYVPAYPLDPTLPRYNVGPGDAAFPLVSNLDNLSMIAGMWSDIRTDRRAADDVYVVQPDRDRVIFRWQGVTYGTETPVSFETELRRDGTIINRYGAGNQNLQPVVVGISGGDPKTYVEPTHTSESAPLSLTNAPSVTFTPRNPVPAPRADLAVSVTPTFDPIISGQQVTYNVAVRNLGPNDAEDVVVTDVLPAGTSYVSCTSYHIDATCSASNGTVTGRAPSLGVYPYASALLFTITAQVNAAPGSTIQNTASAASYRADHDPSNNSASVTTNVVQESYFDAAKAVSAGRQHTTSVRNDGTVWNWGLGYNGALGDGSSGYGANSATPIQVPGIDNVVAVADGSTFVHAVKADGTVWAWGNNNQGQLGDGTTTERTRPVQVSGLTNVVAVSNSSFGFHAMALKSDGTVWAWGSGIPTVSTYTTQTTPAQVPGVSDVKAVATTITHCLFLKSDKTIWAAGRNGSGELGLGHTDNRNNPVPIPSLTNVKAVAVGYEFSLALKEDGTVWAWGSNFDGVIGPNGGAANFDPHPTPVQVTGLPAITSIAAGDDFALALAADGTVWSWGDNNHGQLGQGPQHGGRTTPAQIPNFGGVAAIAGGENHAVALKTDGTVWAWGDNLYGQLGDGTITYHMPPARVTSLETVRAPLLSPRGGTFNAPLDVTISCSTPGAVIRVTTNGLTPTENDPVVANGSTVRVSSSTLLGARAWKAGMIASGGTFARFDIYTPVNPIDTSQVFVTWHYLDFLGRDPDTSGLQFWNDGIESCVADAACREVKRIDTSAAFFLSIEFQETGFLVYRLDKVAYGNLPGLPVPVRRAEFISDKQQIGQGLVVGQGNWRELLEANKQAFILAFVQRQRFTDAFPTSMAPADFVAGLNANTGGALTQAEATALADELTAAGNTAQARASVLRKVAEHAEVSRREFNAAFVLMQYFGYLRRDPDSGRDTDFTGYNFWLSKLNEFNGNYVAAEMVKAFINSDEYRHRFGQ
ncbi:MAG TPA: S8 family serine peptidase [Pyrinomonadaceae bacterium]